MLALVIRGATVGVCLDLEVFDWGTDGCSGFLVVLLLERVATGSALDLLDLSVLLLLRTADAWRVEPLVAFGSTTLGAFEDATVCCFLAGAGFGSSLAFSAFGLVSLAGADFF